MERLTGRAAGFAAGRGVPVGVRSHYERGRAMFYVTAYYKDVPGFKSSERVKYATLPGAEARGMQIIGDMR